MNRDAPETYVAVLLHQLADHARIEPSLTRDPAVTDRVRRPGRPWTLAMLAALVAVVAVAATTTARRGDEQTRVVTAGLAALPGGTTEPLGASGLTGRTGAASVWTGKELLVWSGSTLVGSENRWLADGAALDPGTDRWRPLPPAPIAARSDPATVWTGTEMLVWGGVGLSGEMLSDGAAFDPKTNRWRTIASQPGVAAIRPVAVWTGTEMVVVSTNNTPLTTSAYDPKADRWRRLAAPPGSLVWPYPQAAWTGTELVVLLWPNPPTRPLGPIGTAVPEAAPLAAGPPPDLAAPPALQPGPGTPPPPPVLSPVPIVGGPNSDMFLASYSSASDNWSRLPAIALQDGGLPRLVWTGREVLVLQPSQPGAAFDPKRRTWRSLGSMPTPPGSLAAHAVWTGHLALFWSGGIAGLAYDPAADAWWTFDAGGLASREDPVAAWADGSFVGWSGFNDHDTGGDRFADDGIRYRPPTG